MKHLNNRYNRIFWGWWAATVVLFIFTACMAPVVPETPKQRLGAAYATYAGLVNVTASLVEGGQVSKVQALGMQARLQNVRGALDSSAGLIAQDTPETDTQAIQLIQGALLVLNRLSAELAAKEHPPAVPRQSPGNGGL